ncbi:hypothetical protein AHEVV2_015 [Adoxophyes honmai entomopoxvirus 'L' virophage 2]|nr:hypothetical protein AHEVV2_015 [Adoxophyes honmai entomopoxvirus 'L' virophage 2]
MSSSEDTTDSEDEYCEVVATEPHQRQERILFAISKIENVNEELREEIYKIIKKSRKRKNHPYHKLYTYMEDNFRMINKQKDYLSLEECRLLINIMLKSMIFISYKSDILYNKTPNPNVYYNDNKIIIVNK